MTATQQPWCVDDCGGRSITQVMVRPAIGMSELLSNVGDDQTTADRLLSKIRERLVPMLQKFDKSLETNNLERLSSDANQLKGACGYVAAHDMGDAAVELRKAAEAILDGDAPERPIAELLARVRREIERVADAIDELLPFEDVSASRPWRASKAEEAAAATPEAADLAATAATPPRPAIDMNELLSMIGGNHDMAEMMLINYVERALPSHNTFDESFAKDDIAALRKDAHSLKGASGYVAATTLHKALFALQRGADAILAGEVPEHPLAVLIVKAEDEIARACGAIKELVPVAKAKADAAKAEAARIGKLVEETRRTGLPLHPVEVETAAAAVAAVTVS